MAMSQGLAGAPRHAERLAGSLGAAPVGGKRHEFDAGEIGAGEGAEFEQSIEGCRKRRDVQCRKEIVDAVFRAQPAQRAEQEAEEDGVAAQFRRRLPVAGASGMRVRGRDPNSRCRRWWRSGSRRRSGASAIRRGRAWSATRTSGGRRVRRSRPGGGSRTGSAAEEGGRASRRRPSGRGRCRLRAKDGRGRRAVSIRGARGRCGPVPAARRRHPRA